jgi:hypothetical protein
MAAAAFAIRLLTVRSGRQGSWQAGNEIQKDSSGNVGIVRRHGLQRAVTYAAIAAADEQHSDVGNAREHRGIVTCAACQIKRFDTRTGDGLP